MLPFVVRRCDISLVAPPFSPPTVPGDPNFGGLRFVLRVENALKRWVCRSPPAQLSSARYHPLALGCASASPVCPSARAGGRALAGCTGRPCALALLGPCLCEAPAAPVETLQILPGFSTIAPLPPPAARGGQRRRILSSRRATPRLPGRRSPLAVWDRRMAPRCVPSQALQKEPSRASGRLRQAAHNGMLQDPGLGAQTRPLPSLSCPLPTLPSRLMLRLRWQPSAWQRVLNWSCQRRQGGADDATGAVNCTSQERLCLPS